jgi:hypothetical protein
MGTITTARLLCDFCQRSGETIGEYRLQVMTSNGWKSFWNGWDVCPECWDAGARVVDRVGWFGFGTFPAWGYEDKKL